jgi:hypothetical protein
VFKAIVLWPIAVAMVFAVVGIGAAAIGRVVEGPGLAAKVARVEFANYQLSPLSARFSAKDLSTPIDPPSLAAALRAHKPDKKADPKQLRAAALMAQAYRCMLQEGCRSGLAKVEPEAAANLPYLAAGFLQPLAAKGDASAARDMCLFAIKLGTGYRDAEISRRNCFQAIYASRQSAPAKEVGSKMDDSWSMKRAEVYAFVGELQALVGL